MSSNVVKLTQTKEVSEAQLKKAFEDSSRKLSTHETAVRSHYVVYTQAGFKPVLLHPGKKRPVGTDWIDRPMPAEEDFVGYSNIGIVLGDKSNNLADVDIDHPDLAEHAAWFLPTTHARFGRYYGKKTQTLAHYLYYSQGEKTIALKGPSNSVCIEIRFSGGQTVFPPSFVYDQELQGLDLVCWEGGSRAHIPDLSTIPNVPFEELKMSVNLLAVTVLSAGYFTSGSYHNDMLAWCGMLAKAGYSEEQVKRSITWLVKATGQNNLDDRLSAASDTFERYRNGEMITGISNLKEGGWDEKHITWLRKVLKVKSGLESDGRPWVRVVEAKETELLEETLSAMVATKKFYHMSGQVCIIHHDKTYGAKVTPLMDSIATQSWLTREIMFTKSVLDKTTMQFQDVVVKAPPSVSAEVANVHTYRGDLPHINGVSQIPTITSKGRIVEEHWGYDEDLQVFFACNYPVKKMHLDEACKTLAEPFCDFPFVGGNVARDDKTPGGTRAGRYAASAISAVLTAIVRPVLDICPLYVVTSSQWQDGKSVLCNTVASVVGMQEGLANSPLTRGGSDEEQEKQLSSVLVRGKRVVVFDNHDGEFRSSALTEVLTSSNPEFRMLGKNEVRSVPNRSMFMLNGVNIVLAGDLQTRGVFVRLSRETLDPHRNFKHDDVVGWASNNQSSLVSAAINLMSWALQQDDGKWRPTHRFKTWDRLVRRTIMLTFGVDVAPPSVDDNDFTMDPVEEVKRNLMEWIIKQWELGVRSAHCMETHGQYFQSKDLGDQLAPFSEEEGWVKILSRKPNQQISYQMGVCLRALENVPYLFNFGESKNMTDIYKLVKMSINGRAVYKIQSTEKV